MLQYTAEHPDTPRRVPIRGVTLTALASGERGPYSVYVDEAESWMLEKVGRRMTTDQLGRVIGRYTGP
jgi:hypothetical protein